MNSRISLGIPGGRDYNNGRDDMKMRMRISMARRNKKEHADNMEKDSANTIEAHGG